MSLHLSNNTSSSPFVVRILRCLHFYSTIIKHHIPVITFMRYCKRSFQVSECLKMVITVWNSWEQCKRPIPAGSDLPTVIGDTLTIIVICSLCLVQIMHTFPDPTHLYGSVCSWVTKIIIHLSKMFNLMCAEKK